MDTSQWEKFDRHFLEPMKDAPNKYGDQTTFVLYHLFIIQIYNELKGFSEEMKKEIMQKNQPEIQDLFKMGEKKWDLNVEKSLPPLNLILPNFPKATWDVNETTKNRHKNVSKIVNTIIPKFKWPRKELIPKDASRLKADEGRAQATEFEDLEEDEFEDVDEFEESILPKSTKGESEDEDVDEFEDVEEESILPKSTETQSFPDAQEPPGPLKEKKKHVTFQLENDCPFEHQPITKGVKKVADYCKHLENRPVYRKTKEGFGCCYEEEEKAEEVKKQQKQQQQSKSYPVKEASSAASTFITSIINPSIAEEVKKNKRSHIVRMAKEKKQSELQPVNWKDKVISGEYLVSWDSVVGLKDTKKDLESTFLYALQFPSLFLNKPRNMLLYGPPGTGKTFIIRALAKKMLPHVIVIAPTAADFKSRWVGGTEKQLSSLFDYCNRVLRKSELLRKSDTKKNGWEIQKVIIFFDEFENLGAKRGEGSAEHTQQTVAHMLQMMDGVKSSPNISIIAATNYPWRLDEAILRRFAVKIFIDLPSLPARVELIAQTLAEHYNSKGFKPKGASVPVTNYKDLESKNGDLKKVKILQGKGNDFLSNIQEAVQIIDDEPDDSFFQRSDRKTWFDPSEKDDNTIALFNQDYCKDGDCSVNLNNIATLAYLTGPSYLGYYSGSDLTKIIENAINNVSLRAVTGEKCCCEDNISITKTSVSYPEYKITGDKPCMKCGDNILEPLDHLSYQKHDPYYWYAGSENEESSVNLSEFEIEQKLYEKNKFLRTYEIRQCDLIIGVTKHGKTIDPDLYERLQRYSRGEEEKQKPPIAHP